MSALEKLLSTLAQKSPDLRADFVGHLAFNVIDELDVSALPADMRADLERFIDRAGFEEDDTEEQTRARIDAHFEAHPLDAELVRLFDALEGAIADAETTQAGEQGRAASQALGAAASLKPVGADARKPGQLAGGLLGLLAARTGKSTPAPTREATATEVTPGNPSKAPISGASR